MSSSSSLPPPRVFALNCLHCFLPNGHIYSVDLDFGKNRIFNTFLFKQPQGVEILACWVPPGALSLAMTHLCYSQSPLQCSCGSFVLNSKPAPAAILSCHPQWLWLFCVQFRTTSIGMWSKCHYWSSWVPANAISATSVSGWTYFFVFSPVASIYWQLSAVIGSYWQLQAVIGNHWQLLVVSGASAQNEGYRHVATRVPSSKGYFIKMV